MQSLELEQARQFLEQRIEAELEGKTVVSLNKIQQEILRKMRFRKSPFFPRTNSKLLSFRVPTVKQLNKSLGGDMKMVKTIALGFYKDAQAFESTGETLVAMTRSQLRRFARYDLVGPYIFDPLVERRVRPKALETPQETIATFQSAA